MFAGKTLINKICKIHHGTLPVVYGEYDKSYKGLLQLTNNVLYSSKTFTIFGFEIFQIHYASKSRIYVLLLYRNPVPYDLRKGFKLFLPPARSFRIKLNSVHYRESIIWNNLPSSVKIVYNALELLCSITLCLYSGMGISQKYLFLTVR